MQFTKEYSNFYEKGRKRWEKQIQSRKEEMGEEVFYRHVLATEEDIPAILKIAKKCLVFPENRKRRLKCTARKQSN